MGDYTGYAALIEDALNDERAIVLELSEIVQISTDDFVKMIPPDINIAGKFVQINTKNIQEKEVW